MKHCAIVRNIFIGFLVSAQFVINARAADDWVPVANAVPDVSLAKPGEMMRADEPMHISVSLRIRDKAGLDAIANSLGVGGNTDATLTSQQFLDRFAPTQNQVDAVVTYLNGSGFKNITVAANHLLVDADGSASVAGIAFHVSMRRFVVDGRNAYANLNAPLVPAQLGSIILSIGGLQTVNIPHPLERQ